MSFYFQATTQIIIWCLLIIIIDSFVIIIIFLLLLLFIHYWWPGFDICKKVIIDLVGLVDDYNQILKRDVLVSRFSLGWQKNLKISKDFP